MSIRLHSHSRYERRSLARQQRIQRRLDQVGTPRERAEPPARLRRVSRPARLVLFTLSLVVGLALAHIVTATAVSWWTDRPATVSAIAVQGASRLAPEAVARTTGLSRGDAIGELTPEELALRVRSHPWIRDARIAVLPTGTVIVEIEEHVPRALLERPGQPTRLVDADGVAFAELGEHAAATLPVLVASEEYDASVDATRQGLLLLDRLATLSLPGLARPELPHRGLRLALPADADRGWVLVQQAVGARTGRQVILGVGDTEAVGERLDRLEQLLSAGLRELSETTSIDLRFAGQAVLRSEGSSG